MANKLPCCIQLDHMVWNRNAQFSDVIGSVTYGHDLG